MAKSRHIRKRLSQRGIREEMLGVVEHFGYWQGDRCILNRAACEAALDELEGMKRTLVKVRERGGLVLVEDNGVQITAFPLTGYKKH